eukprot:CAMPEP_0196660814 /NCGR_PEP_ID=MMETSP1086-20130531/41409_1 /TAXON_ID=77921 /ORGANISM="Cyanoptyche  gloeocystis , Strain SAG4.97" /LENGTH=221 /DNA_ID=CAMNT_0041995427 /DNA_START=50 /DNA_END=712 /DNA_ORIENTATION=-
MARRSLDPIEDPNCFKRAWEEKDVEVTEDSVQKIVLFYLIHNNYSETVESLLGSMNERPEKDILTSAALDTINDRKRIYGLILNGQILQAVEETNVLFPNVLKDDQDVLFHLRCQHYIELIREKKVKEALLYAQEELGSFGHNPKNVDTLEDIVLLMCFEDAEASPVGSYMSQSQREKAAEMLNSAVLRQYDMPLKPGLERVAQQTALISRTIKTEAPDKW